MRLRLTLVALVLLLIPTLSFGASVDPGVDPTKLTNEPRWEDLRFPSTAINLAGAPAAPTVNTTTNFGALTFAGNAVNDIVCFTQLPHGYQNRTDLRAHVHVINGSTSTASTTWELWYKIAGVNASFPAAWTVATTTVNLVGSTVRHQLFSLGTVPGTDLTDSGMIHFLVRRLGATDAHNDPIDLIEFDIHYLHDSLGSVAETGDH